MTIIIYFMLYFILYSILCVLRRPIRVESFVLYFVLWAPVGFSGLLVLRMSAVETSSNMPRNAQHRRNQLLD